MKHSLFKAIAGLLFAALSVSCTVDSDHADDPEPEKDTFVEAVDLGLSVKWASCNVGATRPEGYGDYYAWGEIIPKEEYHWSTYKWSNDSEYSLIKYNDSVYYGAVDNKSILEIEDDAAMMNWGEKWRMPTFNEAEELVEKCEWIWTTYNGVAGCKVVSKVKGYENSSIFIPAAGICRDGSIGGIGLYCGFWTASIFIEPSYAFVASYDVYNGCVSLHDGLRYIGITIRAVAE